MKVIELIKRLACEPQNATVTFSIFKKGTEVIQIRGLNNIEGNIVRLHTEEVEQ